MKMNTFLFHNRPKSPLHAVIWLKTVNIRERIPLNMYFSLRFFMIIEIFP